MEGTGSRASCGKSCGHAQYARPQAEPGYMEMSSAGLALPTFTLLLQSLFSLAPQVPLLYPLA